MLDYKRNRLDYGKLLNPPEGFVMETAIATTYSLNLTAFLSIPVALFYRKNLDGKVTADRMDIFDAIQKTSDTITIYCHKAKIKVPEGANQIISFVEDCVVEIMPDNVFKSFHPKIWIIRYKNPVQKVFYRVIVLSKNLTFDRSYDIAFSIEGYVSRTIKNSTKPLLDYVKHLTTYRDFNNSLVFLDDLGKTDFKLNAPFDEFRFHPMGFDNYRNPLKTITWRDLIIVSPFLDKDTLKFFSRKVSGNKYLFSRKEELDKVHLDLLKEYKVFTFSQSIVDGELDIDLQEEADEYPMMQNLHAKLFVGTTTDGKTKWFLGSANCSEPAMNSNEEFLIELTSVDNAASVSKILGVLLSKEEDYEVFQEYSRENKEPTETDEYDFRSDIYKLLKYLNEEGNIYATCELSEEDRIKYDIRITYAPNDIFKSKNVQILVAPYGWKGDLEILGVETEIIFKGLALHHLSPFFIWRIYHLEKDQYKEFITRLNIVMPKERKQAIFQSIIQDKERFIQFIQFLLGANEDSILFHTQEKRKSHNENNAGSLWNTDVNMYEEMLIAASRNPDKLKEIEKLIDRLKANGAEDLIPIEFNMIWEVFKQVFQNG